MVRPCAAARVDGKSIVVRLSFLPALYRTHIYMTSSSDQYLESISSIYKARYHPLPHLRPYNYNYTRLFSFHRDTSSAPVRSVLFVSAPFVSFRRTNRITQTFVPYGLHYRQGQDSNHGKQYDGDQQEVTPRFLDLLQAASGCHSKGSLCELKSAPFTQSARSVCVN